MEGANQEGKKVGFYLTVRAVVITCADVQFFCSEMPQTIVLMVKPQHRLNKKGIVVISQCGRYRKLSKMIVCSRLCVCKRVCTVFACLLGGPAHTEVAEPAVEGTSSRAHTEQPECQFLPEHWLCP